MSTDLAPMPPKSASHAIRPMSRLADITANLDRLWDLSTLLIESRMLPSSIDTPQKAVAIILKGDEIGIPPMLALEQITVIQGKPTISPQLMLGLIERSGQLDDLGIEESPDSCVLVATRKGRSPQRISFSRADAGAMGLGGKDNWKKQFGVMMYWRCVSKMGRRVFPDVIAGLYTHEEMDPDLAVDDQGEIVEQARPSPKPSATPKGSGLFSNEHVQFTTKSNARIAELCREANATWHAAWEAVLDHADGDVSRPAKIEDVINPWQLKAHLVKWAIDAGLLDPSLVDTDPKTRQTDALVALVAKDHRAALKAEIDDYIGKQNRLKEAAIFRKHPGLAPDGWVDPIEAEADRGDAYEGDLGTSDAPLIPSEEDE